MGRGRCTRTMCIVVRIESSGLFFFLLLCACVFCVCFQEREGGESSGYQRISAVFTVQKKFTEIEVAS